MQCGSENNRTSLCDHDILDDYAPTIDVVAFGIYVQYSHCSFIMVSLAQARPTHVQGTLYG